MASSGTSGRATRRPSCSRGCARLEYRGYDSAGIALVTTDGDLFVEKRAGKLTNLRTALLDATPSAAVGLAHTRWATHGRPNDLNAHPHVDCTGDVTVIHNGIIENFQELRDGLAERGHRLASDTDTEALAHLVEEAYDGRPRGGRARRAAPGARRLRGRRDAPRRARPAGRRAHERAAHRGPRARARTSSRRTSRRCWPTPRRSSSSTRATSPTCTPSSVVDHRRRRLAARALVTDIDWSIEAAEKGGYDHFMLKEMHEQPGAIRAAITGRLHGDEIRARRARAGRRGDRERRPGRARRLRQRQLRVGGGRLRSSRTGLACRRAGTSGSEFRYSPPPLDEQDAGDRGHAVGRDGRHHRAGAPARASAAARSSRSPTPSAPPSPARRTPSSSSRPGRRSRSSPPRRSRRR